MFVHRARHMACGLAENQNLSVERKQRAGAFTLVELLVVIAIIGILIGGGGIWLVAVGDLGTTRQPELPRPNRVWNRIPEETRDQIIELALNEPELSPRELAVTFTDTRAYAWHEKRAAAA